MLKLTFTAWRGLLPRFSAEDSDLQISGNGQAERREGGCHKYLIHSIPACSLK